MRGIAIEQFKGTIYEHGYGTVPKRIMQDKKISVGGKALYAYLCSYAWGKSESFPTVNSILDDLGISEKTFSRYRNEIVEAGYVTVEFRKIKGQNRNVYKLNTILTPVKSSGVEKMTPSKNDPPQNSTPNNRRNTLQDKKVSFQENKGRKTNEQKIRDFINESDVSENLKAAFHKFIDYRKDIKKMYKTERPIKALINDLQSGEYTSEDHLIKCIDKAIAKEYQGVFPSYVKETGKQKNDKFGRFMDL